MLICAGGEEVTRVGQDSQIPLTDLVCVTGFSQFSLFFFLFNLFYYLFFIIFVLLRKKIKKVPRAVFFLSPFFFFF